MLKSRLILFLFLIICGVTCRGVYAQKLYLIAEGDVRDEELGSDIEHSRDQITFGIKENMPKKNLVIYNASLRWFGPDISESRNVRGDFLKAIERCPAGPNDTIFFYWCGHGVFDEKEGEHYLKVRGTEDEMIPRKDIRNALKRKRARLAILITDSCSTPIPGGIAPAAAPRISSGMPALYKTLFFKSKGLVDVNSASPGQNALIWKGTGGIFSFWLAMTLSFQVDESLSWSELFDQIDSQMSQMPDVTPASDDLGPESEKSDTKQKVYRIELPE